MVKKYLSILFASALIILALASCSSTGTGAETTIEDEATGAEVGTEVADVASPDWLKDLPAAQDASQVFVVAGIGGTTAYISMHEKNEAGEWKEIISTPGFMGKYGMEKTKEGDARSPVGTYHFNAAFGIADDPGCTAFPYKKVTDDDYWSGDQREGYHYNEMVSLSDYPDLNTEDSEHIVDYINEYQYCLNISWNEDGTAGKGSAIFLHCLGSWKPYTGGCVAIPKDKMITVMQNVKKDCVVIMDYYENISPEIWETLDLKSYKGVDQTVSAKSEDTAENSGSADITSDDPSDFVLISDVVPDAILEIRYYSTYNFVGDRIDGYEEPLAFLTKEAAAALKEVSDDLKGQGYRLKIYDAYRPQMAVTDFVEWSKDADDTRMKEYFYPELEKDVLFPQGYIAEKSGHSRGSTVDLTLFDMETEKEVDMGGTFDYFGELSHPDYTDITEEQYANRMILRDAMLAHGFKPLEEEWWHFTLEDEPYPDTYFTFPINSDVLKEAA